MSPESASLHKPRVAPNVSSEKERDLQSSTAFKVMCDVAHGILSHWHGQSLSATGKQTEPLPRSRLVIFTGSDLFPGKQEKKERGLGQQIDLWKR